SSRVLSSHFVLIPSFPHLSPYPIRIARRQTGGADQAAAGGPGRASPTARLGRVGAHRGRATSAGARSAAARQSQSRRGLGGERPPDSEVASAVVHKPREWHGPGSGSTVAPGI
ncbi:unnamed protein product, partial [Urochloa humidicola]